ncbi:MAG: hypothetical protein Q8Q09_15460 [Deltaproteobacteria bacterium]|nr:hypothetical protein [Deltaproteobacteria bacterium]
MPTPPDPNRLNPATAMARMPAIAQRIALPSGVAVARAWLGDEGQIVVAARDGQLLSINARGTSAVIDRVPGETVSMGERRALALITRAPGEPLVLTEGGALLVQNGLARRAQLPMFLQDARSATAVSDQLMWATTTGLYLGQSAEFVRVDDAQGAVRTATELSFVQSSLGREVWMRVGENLRRLRIREGEAPLFVEMPTNIELGAVRALASMGDDRAVAATARGVFVLKGNLATGFDGGTARGAPLAVAGGGGFAWVLWGTDLLRTDGLRWEAIARDPKFVGSAHIVADTSGNSALVIDDDGGLVRVDLEERVRTSGIRDGQILVDPTGAFEVVPWRSEAPTQVEFFVDAEAMPSVTRTSAPWGWGYTVETSAMGMAVINQTGSRERELSSQLPRRASGPYGTHQIRVVVRYGTTMFERTLGFGYQSPFGRVPTYRADIAPLFAARCARCHDNSVAEELSTYELLRQARVPLRLALRERRMPPDLPLDSVSEALFIAWADGNTPLE